MIPEVRGEGSTGVHCWGIAGIQTRAQHRAVAAVQGCVVTLEKIVAGILFF